MHFLSIHIKKRITYDEQVSTVQLEDKQINRFIIVFILIPRMNAILIINDVQYITAVSDTSQKGVFRAHKR